MKLAITSFKVKVEVDGTTVVSLGYAGQIHSHVTLSKDQSFGIDFAPTTLMVEVDDNMLKPEQVQ